MRKEGKLDLGLNHLINTSTQNLTEVFAIAMDQAGGLRSGPGALGWQHRGPRGLQTVLCEEGAFPSGTLKCHSKADALSISPRLPGHLGASSGHLGGLYQGQGT